MKEEERQVLCKKWRREKNKTGGKNQEDEMRERKSEML